MKTLIFAAALSIGGIAVAQESMPMQTEETTPPAETMQTDPMPAEPMPAEPMPSGQTVSDPSQSTGEQGITQQGTDPGGMATPPAGANQPMDVPAGAMAMPSPNQGAAFTPRPATMEYPPCSRTVTDGCIQTYERGVRRPRR